MTRVSSWPSFFAGGVAQIAIAAAMLVAIGSLGSRPAVFADTAAYVRQGEYWATRLGLSAPLPLPPETASLAALTPRALVTFGPNATTVAAARSPIYGLFLFLLAKIGTLWLVAFAQAVAAVATIRIAVRTVRPDDPAMAFWIAIAVLATATGLPFFAAFAMPDLFGGVAILACTLLFAAPRCPSRGEHVCLWILLAMALCVHAANIPIVVALATVAFGHALRRGRPVKEVAYQAGALAVAVALVGIAGLLFQESFRRDTGFAWSRPPFFMTRMLLDGPGKLYLDATCPGGASPTLCRFKDRPMSDEHDVLWKTSDGIFGSADYATRLQLEKDEPSFVAASIGFAPRLALTAAATNGLRQLATFVVDDPLADPARYISHPWIDTPAIRHLLPGLEPCLNPGGCRVAPVPILIALLSIEHTVVLLCCLIILVRAAIRTRRVRDIEARKVMDMVLLLLLGVVINAMVCGVLSAVSARYEARVIWLVPLAAVLADLAFARGRVIAAEAMTRGVVRP